ncbi:MAG: hypothetical protein EXS13_06405 [Planctomycetes bacterium]|nr:hypothetical protein [Planctomycetota bacterium]
MNSSTRHACAGRSLHAAMLTAFDYTPVLDTAVQHDGLRRDEAADRFNGLLQWLSAIPFARPGQPIQMVEDIDRLWHAFVLNTKLYRAFGDRFFGRYIDHDPLDRNCAELSKKQYARFTLATLTEELGADLHPAFRDLTQRVGCCFGQCDDGAIA